MITIRPVSNGPGPLQGRRRGDPVRDRPRARRDAAAVQGGPRLVRARGGGRLGRRGRRRSSPPRPPGAADLPRVVAVVPVHVDEERVHAPPRAPGVGHRSRPALRRDPPRRLVHGNCASEWNPRADFH